MPSARPAISWRSWSICRRMPRRRGFWRLLVRVADNMKTVRRLFTILAALSLVLCTGVLLLSFLTRRSYAIAIPPRGAPSGIWIGLGTVVVIQHGHFRGDIPLKGIALVLCILPALWLVICTRLGAWCIWCIEFGGKELSLDRFNVR